MARNHRKDATVRVDIRVRGGGQTGETARSDFWNSLTEPRGPERRAQAEDTEIGEREDKAHELERDFLHRFPQVLVFTLLGGERSHSLGTGVPFWISIGRHSYGSLSVDLLITGADKFLQFFGENIDVCEAALSTLVPEALDRSVRASVSMDRIDGVSVDATDLARFTRTVDEQAVATSARPAEPPRVADPPNKDERRLLLWRAILNNTLLVPVVLALGVLFAAFTALREDKAALERRADDALKQDREFIQRADAVLQRETERTNFWAQMSRELVTNAHGSGPSVAKSAP